MAGGSGPSKTAYERDMEAAKRNRTLFYLISVGIFLVVLAAVLFKHGSVLGLLPLVGAAIAFATAIWGLT